MIKRTRHILMIIVLFGVINLIATTKIGSWPFTADLKDTTANA
jgi:hypothetical protein